jgi:quercetin dioxygenase-like cupin family protein
MTIAVRRVVTGHDAAGKAIVLIDDAPPARLNTPGTEQTVFWTTRGFPVNNDASHDTREDIDGITVPGGSVFRVVEYAPGRPPRNHRTDSIDYAVVMHGEIDMELDDGLVVHVRAGDVLVQRGTIHNWANNGTEPCLIAFMLIDAKPVEKGGRVLSATV